MGFQNKGNGNILFVNATKGKLVVSKTGDEYTEFTGLLAGIEFRDDEYQNKKIRKCVMKFYDSDPNPAYRWVYITFNAKSNATPGVLKRIGQADLSRPITLKAMGSDQNDKITFLTIWQDDKSVEVDSTLPYKYDEDTGWRSVLAAFEKLVKTLEFAQVDDKSGGKRINNAEVEEAGDEPDW